MVDMKTSPNKKKLRIAWFSDLESTSSKSQTRSAYTSKLLLPLLREKFDLNLFHNSFEKYQNFPTYHALTAIERHESHPYDLFFYHLEDSPLSQWTRIHSCLMPGVGYFHDFLFTSFGPEPILNSTWQTTLEKLHQPEVAWAIRNDEQFQSGPHAIREASFASVRIFSQPGMLKEAARLVSLSPNPDLRTAQYYLPYPIEESIFASTPKQTNRVLYCGSPWIQDRAHKVLQAVHSFGSELEFIWLTSKEDLETAQKLAEEFSVTNIEIIAQKNLAKWKELIDGGGLAVHTLFSVFGQSGPFLEASLAAGLPTIVSNFGNSEYLPDNLVFKVQSGETEAAEILEILKVVFEQRALPDAELLKSYARENFDLQVVAEELDLIFQAEASRLKACMVEWEKFKATAKQDLIKEALSFLPALEFDLGIRNSLVDIYQELGWKI